MYENRIAEKVEVNTECNVPPMSVLLDEVNCKATEAVAMVDKINRHLFGYPESDTANNRSPSCFAEALEIQNRNISEICAGLRFLMDRLGV